jgi:hypothetical protein
VEEEEELDGSGRPTVSESKKKSSEKEDVISFIKK